MNLEYWKKRCQLAERIIDESPHNKNTLPTVAKLNAVQEWANHIAGEKQHSSVNDESKSFIQTIGELARDYGIYANPLIDMSRDPQIAMQTKNRITNKIEVIVDYMDDKNDNS